jgi:hypothetical protein
MKVKGVRPKKFSQWVRVCKTLTSLGADSEERAVERDFLHREKGCIQYGYDPIRDAGLMRYVETGPFTPEKGTGGNGGSCTSPRPAKNWPGCSRERRRRWS